MSNERRYHAFISYAHDDERFANWLLKAIEAYRVPRSLAGQTRDNGVIPKRITPVFKDREELASTGSLSAAVETALRNSQALIVVCSPAAKESAWVNEEISRYRILHGDKRVFSIVAAGDAASAFPPALTQVMDEQGEPTGGVVEPLAADVHGDGRHNAKLKVIAGLLGVSFDDLKQRDLHQRYRRMSYVAASAALVVLTLAASLVWAIFAQREADLRRSQAEGLVEFMIVDLRKRLEEFGRLDVLDDVGQEAMDYFSTVDADTESPSSRSRRAMVVGQLGEIRLAQGDLPQARPMFAEALALQRSAFEQSPTAAMRFALSQASFWLGYSYWEEGDLAAALPHLTAYQEHSDILARAHPHRLDWQMEQIYARINLGTVHWESENYPAALEDFLTANDHLSRLLATDPNDPGLLKSEVAALGWVGGTLWEMGRTREAAQTFRRQTESAQHQLAQAPHDFDLRESHALAMQHFGHALVHTGESGAGPVLDQAVSAALDLVERDSTNIFWRHALAKSYWYSGEALEADGALEEALARYVEADAQFDRTRSELSRPGWHVEHARLANDIASVAMRLGSAADGRRWLLKSAALLDGAGASRQVAYVRAETAILERCGTDPGIANTERIDVSTLLSTYEDSTRADHQIILATLSALDSGAGSIELTGSLTDSDQFEINRVAACLGLAYQEQRMSEKADGEETQSEGQAGRQR